MLSNLELKLLKRAEVPANAPGHSLVLGQPSAGDAANVGLSFRNVVASKGNPGRPIQRQDIEERSQRARSIAAQRPVPAAMLGDGQDHNLNKQAVLNPGTGAKPMSAEADLGHLNGISPSAATPAPAAPEPGIMDRIQSFGGEHPTLAYGAGGALAGAGVGALIQALRGKSILKGLLAGGAIGGGIGAGGKYLMDANAPGHLTAQDIARVLPAGARGFSLERMFNKPVDPMQLPRS